MDTIVLERTIGRLEGITISTGDGFCRERGTSGSSESIGHVAAVRHLV